MTDYKSIYQQNLKLADQINDEALKNPNSPNAGNFIGIADGRLIMVGSDLKTVIEKLEEVVTDRRRCLCFEAGVDYGETVFLSSPIWQESELSGETD